MELLTSKIIWDPLQDNYMEMSFVFGIFLQRSVVYKVPRELQTLCITSIN